MPGLCGGGGGRRRRKRGGAEFSGGGLPLPPLRPHRLGRARRAASSREQSGVEGGNGTPKPGTAGPPPRNFVPLPRGNLQQQPPRGPTCAGAELALGTPLPRVRLFPARPGQREELPGRPRRPFVCGSRGRGALHAALASPPCPPTSFFSLSPLCIPLLSRRCRFALCSGKTAPSRAAASPSGDTELPSPLRNRGVPPSPGPPRSHRPSQARPQLAGGAGPGRGPSAPAALAHKPGLCLTVHSHSPSHVWVANSAGALVFLDFQT